MSRWNQLECSTFFKAELENNIQEYERSELEKLENRLKNLKSSNVSSQSSDKNEEPIKGNNELPSHKNDPTDILYKKMLEDEEKKQKAKQMRNDDEVKNWTPGKLLRLEQLRVIFFYM